MKVGENIKKGQKKISKYQNKAHTKTKKTQKKIQKTEQPIHQPKKRVDVAKDKTKSARGRYSKRDKYRPLMKEGGEHTDRYDLNKMQLLVVVIICLMLGLVFLPIAICCGAILFVFAFIVIGAMGGIKKTVSVIKWLTTVGVEILRVLRKIGSWIYQLIRRLFKWLRDIWPFKR